MYCVKEKHFADTVQYQIFEKQGRREVEDDNLEHLYLFEKTNKNKNKPRKFEFDDGTVEYLTKMKENEESDREHSICVSRSRTIKKIYDIGRSNYWEWWITLTLNKEKVNRYDYSICSQKLKNWLDYLRDRNPDMIYLIVPEKHDDGAWHFHGLFANMNDNEFSISGKYTDKGQEIYKMVKYKYGWSYAVRLDGSFAIVSYMTKYITKDLCEMTKGKKRYWASRNVNLPEIIEYELNTSLEDIIDQLDLSDARIITKEGYVNVTYIDKPKTIYSKNMCLWNRLVRLCRTRSYSPLHSLIAHFPRHNKIRYLLYPLLHQNQLFRAISRYGLPNTVFSLL